VTANMAAQQAQTPPSTTQNVPATPVQTPAQTTPPPGPVLSLDEALTIAEQSAFDVRTSESQLRRTKGRLNEVRGLAGPRVTTNATYTRFDKEIRSTSSGSGGGSSVVQPIDQKQAGVQFSMPLDITGTIGRGVKGASATVRASEANVETARNTLRLNVRSAYFNVLRAQALVGVAEQTLQNAQQSVRTEEQREAAGVSARVDVLRLQTQLAQAQADLIAAQSGLALAKENLNNVLARPIETPYSVQEPTTLPDVTVDANTLTATAVTRRPEIRAIRYQRQALAWVTRAQEGGLLPSLNLTANYNRNIGASGNQRDYTAFATVGLSWPIFDSGVTRARVQQAREDERQAEIQQEQLELGVSLEVRQAMTNLVNAKSTLQVAQTQVTVATETYRLAQVRLQAGEGTSLEVTNALTDLTRAQNQLANARYNYLTAYAQLQRAVAADDPNAAPPEQGTGKK
ncbi:MAG: outer membrane protein, partial [Fimbriimonadaceae bacterium]|nr:outer membrane protein [Fimbriimonadaceae bacterium]